jgi:hypothetical protein
LAEGEAGGAGVRIAVADPPYPGQSKRLYGDHPDYAGEVDHGELVDRLMTYDAWALHTSASALQQVLSLCPPPQIDQRKNIGRVLDGTGCRVLVWIKGQICWRPVRIQYDWEPIIVYGGRRTKDTRPVLKDWIHANPRDGNQFTGAKPYDVCRYVFDALGAEPQDDLDDLFPGSGAVGRAWDAWSRQGSLL